MLTIAIAAFVLSYVLVGGVRAYAIRAGVIDRPTDRSSHSVPTPRGGGLGLVAAFLLVVAIVGGARNQLTAPVGAVLLAVAAVAAVGWVDDRRSLAVWPRLATHISAGAIVAWLAAASGAPPFADAPPPAALLAAAWWAFWSVSAINVVNFMDGIDGLIGSQIALFAASVAARAAPGSFAALFATALAAASAGFLPWNWAPAKVFLGDVGSGALGLAAVVAGLLLVAGGRANLVGAYLPLVPLFADATATIVRRARRGERLTEAHRSHLYQRLANGGWTHARVSAVYFAAAAVGAGVAISPPWVRGPLAAGYVAAVIIAGLWLERRAPFPPRRAAVPDGVSSAPALGERGR
jgi:Fuc2NAc and GlcNAc transferase